MTEEKKKKNWINHLEKAGFLPCILYQYKCRQIRIVPAKYETIKQLKENMEDIWKK